MIQKHGLARFLLVCALGVIFASVAIKTQAQSQETLNTILVLDISGSMDGQDSNRVVKLRAAQEAAIAFIEAIQAEKQNRPSAARDSMALVVFCNDATLTQNFTEDLNIIRNRIISLRTCGVTNMEQAFQIVTQLAQSRIGTSSKPVNIILLGDGMPTASSSGSSNAQTLQNEVIQVAQGLRNYDACLYVIAIGNPSATSQSSDYVDINFLRQVKNAVNASCGEVYSNDNTSALIQNYLSIRVISQGGQVNFGQTSIIQPNQTIQLQPFEVTTGTQQLRVDVSVSGGSIIATLFDPQGVQVNAGYPGAFFSQLGGITQILVDNPTVGTWRTQVFGSGVPATGANFTAVVSTTRSQVGGAIVPVTPSTSIGTVGGGGSGNNLALLGIVIILMLLLAGGLYMALGRGSVSQAEMGEPIATVGYLVFLNGAQRGQTVTINRQMFDIGRGAQNQLLVADSRVSRSHSRIFYRDGTFFIQDLNSRVGTFVNERKIQTVQPLQNGDMITIGSVSVQFRR